MEVFRGCCRRLAGVYNVCIFTALAHFEALRLQSQQQKLMPSCKNAYEITLRSSDRTRSGSPQLGAFWSSLETPRRPPGDHQETSGTLQESLGAPQQPPQEPSRKPCRKPLRNPPRNPPRKPPRKPPRRPARKPRRKSHSKPHRNVHGKPHRKPPRKPTANHTYIRTFSGV